MELPAGSVVTVYVELDKNSKPPQVSEDTKFFLQDGPQDEGASEEEYNGPVLEEDIIEV